MAGDGPVRYPWVFFDLGGTLVDEHDYPAWIDLGRRLGLELSEDHLAHAIQEVTRETDTAAPPPFESWWHAVLEKATGRPVSPVVTEEFLALWWKLPPNLRLYSDARRCLVQLQGDHRHLGVISNSRSEARVREILDHAGIVEFFEVVVSSGTEGVAKPNPEIFRRAAARATIPAASAFYVGDLAYRDAKAAAAAGFGSVWLNREGWGFGEDPPEITSLTELPFHIWQLEGRSATVPVK